MWTFQKLGATCIWFNSGPSISQTLKWERSPPSWRISGSNRQLCWVELCAICARLYRRTGQRAVSVSVGGRVGIHRAGGVRLGLDGGSGIWGRGKHISKGREVGGHTGLLGDDGWSFPGQGRVESRVVEGGWTGRGLGCHSSPCSGTWPWHSFLPSFTYSAFTQLLLHGCISCC